MARKTNTTANTKEEIKMAKYIVEAPEPQKGQKLSSGGIRENGKLASQFKNPVPYKEPTLPPTVVTQKSDTVLFREKQATTRRNTASTYLLSIVWTEFGEPVFRSILHKLGKIIISKIEAPTKQTIQPTSSSVPETMDVENVEVDENEFVSEDKIIRFPNKKVV